MAHSAQEVVLAYPLPERVRCPRCWCSEDSGVKVRGEYCDAAHLAKHQKAKHPGDTISYKCSACNFKGTGRYPLKIVKIHYEKEHGVPLRGENDTNTANDINNNINKDAAGEPGPRAGDVSSLRGGFADLQVAGVLACPSGSAPRASASTGGRERGRASESRQLRLPFTATPTGEPTTTTTTTTTTAARSPSYAAVTAAEPPVAKPPSPLAARRPRVTAVESVVHRIKVVRRRPAEAAATSAPPTAATEAPPRVPVGVGALRKTAPTARPSKPPARVPPRPARGGTTKRPTDRTPPSTAGSTNGMTTRSRRSASVPVELSAARPARLPPRPSPTSSVEESPMFGGRGGKLRRSPGITPPHTTAAGPTTRNRSRATSVPVENSALDARRAALARPPARAASRGCPGKRRTPQKSPGTQPAATTSAGSATRTGTTARGILG